MNLNFDVMHFFVFVITQMYFHLCLSSLRCNFICVCIHSCTFICVCGHSDYFRLCCHHSDVLSFVLSSLRCNMFSSFEMLLVFDSKSADVYSVNFVNRVNTIM